MIPLKTIVYNKLKRLKMEKLQKRELVNNIAGSHCHAVERNTCFSCRSRTIQQNEADSSH